MELSSLYDDLVSADRKPRTEVLDLRVVPAPAEVVQALELPPGTEVTWIERLRYAGGEPLQLRDQPLSRLIPGTRTGPGR